MDRSARRSYLGLVLAILVAAGVLGYFSVQSAQQFTHVSEQSVLESTLLLVDEKIDRVERMIISTDEAVFTAIDVERPETVEETWPLYAPRLSPSVRAVVVLDADRNVRAHACRCSDADASEFLDVLLDELAPELEIGATPSETLRHLHHGARGQSYLLAYREVVRAGARYVVIAHHDTGYFVRQVFPSLFELEGAGGLSQRFSVTDGAGQLVFGRRLSRAGGYVVGRTFPTTLYEWRLQLAPDAAPTLIDRGETRLFTESALIVLALGVLLLGLAFLLYAGVQESRVNALRSEFIANVSHELKTPLSVVRMFSEMLLTDRVQGEKKRRIYLETILHESERLSALIENVLDFSAIERGKEAYQLREADLVELVQRAIDTVRFRADQAGAEVTLDAPSELPVVRIDEQAMLLVLMNLLDNAIKYGLPRAPGGAPARVDVLIEKGRRHVYVHVRDHGPGIPEEHHHRVFERFFRVKQEGDAQVRGSGIGLALVKRIVEAHGGKAWVEKAPGGGARVSISIPFATLSTGASETEIAAEREARETPSQQAAVAAPSEDATAGLRGAPRA